MSTDTAEVFFSLLALVANAATLALLVAHVLARRAPATPVGRTADDALAAVGDNALVLAAAVALTCTVGSLYFSEVANFTPCTLCWYQRIAMYPLAVVLAIAAVRADTDVRVYVWPVAAIGAVIALYHFLLERFPKLDAGACSLEVPCEVVWFRRFGFITLSYMALSGFLFIGVLLVRPPHREEP